MEKLDKHLIPAVFPAPLKEAVYETEGLRITVLKPRLIRVEWNEKGQFCVDATQIVWFRNFTCPFTVKETETEVNITTGEASFHIAKKGLKKSCVSFPSGNTISCLDKANLLGTARTLDKSNGKIKNMEKGVLNRQGVAVLVDDSLILGEDGMVRARNVLETDAYIFAYGHDYREAIRALFAITGSVPLIPRYALGNWWSRYKAYTQSEYEKLMSRFTEKGIPLSVATIDMDWHWVDVKKRFGVKNTEGPWYLGAGWTGYSWNKELFPDYQSFLKYLKGKGLKVTLNMHPSQGVRYYETQYAAMAKALGMDPAEKKPIKFDITSPSFINAYFRYLHKPYEKEGVDFWWIDWQQGTKSALAGLDPLWSLNHFHTLDNAESPDEKKKRPLILSRYAGIGSHRYPLGFSGDTYVSWKSLAIQPYFTNNAANAGYTWWSHDIGGHMLGRMDDEMYLRWLQYGVFSPINRLHSTNNEFQGKEPWKFPSDIEKYATFFLRFRHRLVPYLYTMNHLTNEKGLAVCEPMYYGWPEREEAYLVKNQYMFGTELMVCPITRKASRKTEMAYVRAFLPEGRWTDIFTGYVYEGDRMLDLVRDESKIPVLAKAGAIIPLSNDSGNGVKLPENLEIWAYCGNGTFEMYEDDDLPEQVMNHATTKFEIEESEDIIFRINPVSGDSGILPSTRNYRICFKDLVTGSADIALNGEQTKKQELKDNPIVQIALKPTDKLVISIKNGIRKTNPEFSEWAVETLSKIQGSNFVSMLRSVWFKKARTKEKYVKIIKKLHFDKIAVKAVMELY